MTVEDLINNIECMRYVMIQHDRRVPKYISMNENTRHKLKKYELFHMEILIDDKLADDEFRLLRK
jgi:hypothetical protein